MPAEQKSDASNLLRLIVPVVVIALGVAFIVLMNTGAGSGQPQAQNAPGSPEALEQAAPSEQIEQDSAPAESQPGDDTPAQPESTQDAEPSPTEPIVEDTPAQGDPSVEDQTTQATPVQDAGTGMRALGVEAPATAPASLGSLDPASGFASEIEFTRFGAGIEAITLTNYFDTIKRQNNYELQRLRTGLAQNGQTVLLASLAARGVYVNGQWVDLFSAPSGAPVWSETAPGSFVATIVDDAGAPMLSLERAYDFQPGSFELTVRQTVQNLSDEPVDITWLQYGPIDLPVDQSGYRLDLRRVRFGYLLTQRRDPSRQLVQADGELTSRSKVIDRRENGDNIVWPRENFKHAAEPVWMAQTSRYFVFAVHPMLERSVAEAHNSDPVANPLTKSLDLAGEVYSVVWPDPIAPSEESLLLQMNSRPFRVEAGQTQDLSFMAYAGPLGKRQLSARINPVFEALGLRDMVVYNIGGPCAFCTFQPLAKGLLWTLGFFHDYLVFDWALAIMLLVVCVRTVLHPITKKSQIGIMRFSKQMQRLAPKQQKLRERYKDDPKRMQQEMMKLMKEEGVSYAGMLGCLPMFLQTPIWVALYAMLYFAFDLRHEAAFFGVFQNVTGGSWSFLADLSSADHFIDFGQPLFSLPLFGTVSGFNILPLLLGLVFFLQQKYLTPPPSPNMTPEQLQQQKIMKVMMVIMFPVLMYNAPSGLSLYFITNSALGILESRYIRSHVDKEDLESPKEAAIGPAQRAMMGQPSRKKVKNQAPANPFGKKRSDAPKRFKDRNK